MAKSVDLTIKKEFVKNVHYYMDKDKIVFTERWHVERGYCCGSKCRHCPYFPQYEKNSTEIEEKFAHLR